MCRKALPSAARSTRAHTLQPRLQDREELRPGEEFCQEGFWPCSSYIHLYRILLPRRYMLLAIFTAVTMPRCPGCPGKHEESVHCADRARNPLRDGARYAGSTRGDRNVQ